MGTSRPVLVIVNGHPATGKTTFARGLAKKTGLPLFAKDDLKERLHESLGAADREDSRKLGLATYSLLRHAAETMLTAGQGLILESNFDANGSGPWIRELETKFRPQTIQVFLNAEPEVIIDRCEQRADQRHPAHFDVIASQELRKRLQQPYAPLEVNGDTLEFDTTEIERFDFDAAIDEVGALIKSDVCI